MLLLLALLSTAVSRISGEVRPFPKPMGNPSEWIKGEGYPKSAFRIGASGRTNYRLKVDALGVVSGCTVLQSSGNDSLDAAACALLKEQARFIPATDNEGRPISGIYISSIAWELPQLPFPLIPSAQTVTFDVDAQGTVIECKAEGAALPGRPTPEQLCDFMVEQSAFSWAEGQKPSPKHVVIRSSVQVTDQPPRIDTLAPRP